MSIQVLVPLVGVSAETVQLLMDERLHVERGCDPLAYGELAVRFAHAGMIAAANRLMDKARYYLAIATEPEPV